MNPWFTDEDVSQARQAILGFRKIFAEHYTNAIKKETPLQDLEQFVPQHCVMDPKNETVMYGDQLMNGMRVLVECSSNREAVVNEEFMDPRRFYNALKKNRWCFVTELRVDGTDQISNTVNINVEADEVSFEGSQFNLTSERSSGRRIHFIGVYDDGTEFVREASVNQGWVVKIDSVPEEKEDADETPEDQIRKSIFGPARKFGPYSFGKEQQVGT